MPQCAVFTANWLCTVMYVVLNCPMVHYLALYCTKLFCNVSSGRIFQALVDSFWGLPNRVECLWLEDVMLLLSKVPLPHLCGLTRGLIRLIGDLLLGSAPPCLALIASSAPSHICQGS